MQGVYDMKLSLFAVSSLGLSRVADASSFAKSVSRLGMRYQLNLRGRSKE
jgi:hypothetical protein